MAKSPRSGEGRGRRPADRRRPAEESGALSAPTPEAPPATARDVVAKTAASVRERLRRAPGREEIAARAYEIYRARGGTHGYDIEDWLQAERELSRR